MSLIRQALPPVRPVSRAEALALYPELRQSTLAAFDDCNLRALFDLRHARGWSSHPQSAGILFHRFAAEALRVMMLAGEERIPVAEALELLYWVVRQKDVPMDERVVVPLRDLRTLRMAVIKWAAENSFSVSRIVDIERRLRATVSYDPEDGTGLVERVLTGQLDVLLFEPPDTAVVIDWKLTFGLPPERMPTTEVKAQNEANYISYEGYFQQRFYGLLVLRNYPSIQAVKLREFYPLKGRARTATLYRADLEHVEREMALKAEAFDDAVTAGTLYAGTAGPGDAWPASPGKHCSFCARPGRCPIEPEARGSGAIQDAEMAARYAAEREVATRVRDHRTDALKPWVAVHGPVELKHSKGRRAIAWVPNKTGRGHTFREYVPEESDRGGADPNLEESMLAAAREAEAARARNRRGRKGHRAA